MGYPIFEINAFRQLTFLESVAEYRAAKKIVNDYRRGASAVPGSAFRIMFAGNQHLAERLLQEKREARPMGEHD